MSELDVERPKLRRFTTEAGHGVCRRTGWGDEQ